VYVFAIFNNDKIIENVNNKISFRKKICRSFGARGRLTISLNNIAPLELYYLIKAKKERNKIEFRNFLATSSRGAT